MSTTSLAKDRHSSLKRVLPLLFVLLVSPDLFAFSCGPSATEIEHWEWSTHVFSAHVLGTRYIPDCDPALQKDQVCWIGGRVEASFKVLVSFKGGEPDFDRVSIKTGGGASEYVNPDKEYLFMVKESESGVWIDSCSPPIELGSEVEEIFWRRLNLGIQEKTLKEISEVYNEN